ncbi:chemotaxis protein CheW [Bacillus sp. ISL-41]|uniref:chemotaxis protein CheW n=1 Tax=Bacillus sp. ISL-41 TaxID=2819127 RepID=UPI001BE82D9B|nr:chemotaxis protein CheW [Bacillus sp. ISL-41]MBT2643152.1 chemotaxis protein CheW [Bacillus sp. ISL-41]
MKKTFILFKANDAVFGVDLRKVISIEKKRETTSIPKSSEYIVGIANIRGEIIPVIDSNQVLYNQKINVDEEARYILLDIEGVTIALMVENTNEIIDLHIGTVSPVKIVNESNFVDGVVLEGDRIISILNIEEMLLSLKDIENFKERYISNGNQ